MKYDQVETVNRLAATESSQGMLRGIFVFLALALHWCHIEAGDTNPLEVFLNK